MTDQERIAKLEELLNKALINHSQKDHLEQMYHDWAQEAEKVLAPPTPGLLECREICDQYHRRTGMFSFKTGRYDQVSSMKATLAAYNAGLNAKDLIAKSIDGRVWYKVNV